MSKIRNYTLLSCVSMLAFSSAALAQEVAPADGARVDEAIIVTGSRVIKNGDQAPQPLTVVQTDELLRQSPTTVADGLNALPVFAGSRGPSSSITTTGNGAGGNGAANQLNLRGLGSIRNLILFDGQRLPTALFNGVVDVDIVPDLLTERVDVVTGGVSAVYGSDAISGVVNFITNKKFNGLKADAHVGFSDYGDAPNWKIGVAAGTKLGDRGHIEASYSFLFADPPFFRTDRPFGYDYAYGGLKVPFASTSAECSGLGGAFTTATSLCSIAQGTINNPYTLIAGGARNTSATWGGKITSSSVTINGTAIGSAGATFEANGVARPFNVGTATNSPNLGIGGDGFYNNSSMGATQRSHLGFGRFDYELADDVNFHAQGIISIKDNTVWGNYAQFPGNSFAIKGDNAFLKQTNLGGYTATSLVNLSKSFQQAPRLQDDVHTEQWYVNAGLDGKFGTFDWGMDFNYGHAKLSNVLTGGNANNQHLAAAIDAVDSGAFNTTTQQATGTPNGNIVCRINVDNIATNDDASCAALNPFGPTSASQAAINYVFGGKVQLIAVNTNLDFNAHISGEVFNLGAGPAIFALSGTYRRNTLQETTIGNSNDTVNCSGLSILTANTATSITYANNCVPVGAMGRSTAGGVTTNFPLTPTALYANAFAPLAQVSEEVKEASLEAAVPLLTDTGIGSVDVSGALRFADYKNSGSTWVWKGGVNWQVTDSLRLRGTISRDFRAPTLNDLFQPVTTTLGNNADLLTGVSGIQIRTQGNPNLKPEVGHTITAGAVFKPSFAPGLSLALDYYHIRISNAIQSVSGQTPAVQTACLASGGTSPFCLLQPRANGYTDTSSANAPLYYLSQVLNFAEVTTEGVDGELNYNTRLGGRPASLRALVSWQPKIVYGDQPGATASAQNFNAAGSASADGTINGIAPEWRITAAVHVEPTDWLKVDVRERWRSSMRYNPISTTYFAQRVASVATTDLALTLHIPDNNLFEVYANVTNLFNKAPPGYQTGVLPGQGFLPGDDFLGRYYTMGVRLKM